MRNYRPGKSHAFNSKSLGGNPAVAKGGWEDYAAAAKRSKEDPTGIKNIEKLIENLRSRCINAAANAHEYVDPSKTKRKMIKVRALVNQYSGIDKGRLLDDLIALENQFPVR